ncbi:MAG: sugar transferase [Deltaproteobacteria bacterium]|nr:sugar transferase [Deltaproteobacteria bacterium]
MKLKRVFDVAASAWGLAVLSPVLLAMAAAVKLSSPGPALFGQVRVGKGGRPFTLYKFRSMRAGSDGMKITSSGDGRVTGVGRFLRKTKLDEIPELFNVLRGDMSFVGPRPEVPEYVERYRPEWRRVLDVRPGITDPATIRFRNEESILAEAEDKDAYYVDAILPEKLGLNLEYLEHAGFTSDLAVVFRTLAAIVVR